MAEFEPMIKKEALEFLAQPLLDFKESMELSQEEWRIYVRKTLEALKVSQQTRRLTLSQCEDLINLIDQLAKDLDETTAIELNHQLLQICKWVEKRLKELKDNP